MNRNLLVLISYTLTVLHLICSSSIAEDKYVDYKRYDGVDVYKLFNDPKVKKSLSKLLGKEVNTLQDNLGVSGNTEKEKGTSNLVAEGIAPHSGGIDEGIFTFNMTDGSVAAAILSDGKTIKVYTDKKSISVPNSILDWVNKNKAYNQKISIKYIKK